MLCTVFHYSYSRVILSLSKDINWLWFIVYFFFLYTHDLEVFHLMCLFSERHSICATLFKLSFIILLPYKTCTLIAFAIKNISIPNRYFDWISPFLWGLIFFCSIIQQLFLPLLLLRKYHQDNFISFCVVNNYFPYHSSFLQSSNETSISSEVLVSSLIILQYSFTSSDCLYLNSLL